MKVNAIISALLLASVATAIMPDDPNKIDTCKTPGQIAYTFDDGPGPYNDKLLDILDKHGVKVTFFMVGQMIEQYPDSLKKILARGHQLASHTYTHSNLNAMNEAGWASEVDRTSDIMFKYANVRPTYIRAPEGRCEGPCAAYMEKRGLVLSHWNADTNDWRHKTEAPETATTNSMKEVEDVIVGKSNNATDSFILLQHEIHPFSVNLLVDRVIPAIKNKGYKFVTMEECHGVPAYYEGTAPPTTNPGTPGTPGTPVPSTNVTVPTGVVPGNNTVAPTASGSSAVPSASPNQSKDTVNGAGFLKAGAWAMGVAVAMAYAMI